MRDTRPPSPPPSPAPSPGPSGAPGAGGAASQPPAAGPTAPRRAGVVTQLTVGALAATSVFAVLPDLDLQASRSLLDAGGRFVLDGNSRIYAVNDTITLASRIAVVALLAGCMAAWLPVAPLRWRAWRRPMLFLLVTLVLGPGLLVNSVLKEHSGRARPIQTTLFGGEKGFTPAWIPADQCATNCSFVSGHAAVSAWPAAGYWLARRRGTRRAWLAFGLAAGLGVGFGRMATGSHFASDVLVAVLLTVLVCAACAAWLLRPPPDEPGARTPAPPPASPPADPAAAPSAAPPS